jgi:hypothetical protein
VCYLIFRFFLWGIRQIGLYPIFQDGKGKDFVLENSPRFLPLPQFLNISYQERLREMALRSLDNLFLLLAGKRCQLHPNGLIGTDKSDKSL